MELMSLKPSLSSKLNVSGFSQMHLALQNNYSRMVRGFIAIINSLVRIKGRGRVTPLHHVARIGDAELLSEFLFSCPSIEDLTIKCETTVHVAVKNHQWMTFKVLLGWLKRVMKLLHKTVKIFEQKMYRLLRNGTNSWAGNLSSIRERSLNTSKRNDAILVVAILIVTATSKRNDAILVVAILIVTATYRAGFSPPGRFWQESSSNPHDHNSHSAGQMIMPFNISPVR
ncbi:unnamed protein product [Brassica oleracea]